MSSDFPRPWWSGAAAAWDRASQAVVLSDMAACEPAAALAPRARPGCWRVAQYEAAGREGRMILACPDAGAATVSLPLPATGLHAVFVGLYGTRTCPAQVWLKLDGDEAPLSRSSQPDQGMWSIEEVFLRVADLDGGRLHVGQQRTGLTSLASLAWVKLIPLSEREAAAWAGEHQTATDPQAGRGLTATCDGFSFLCTRSPRTAEEVRRELEPLRHAGCRTLLLHLVHGDTVRYPSPYHQGSFTGAACFPKPIYRYGAEALAELERAGINYARVLIDGAREMGLAVHAGLRPGGWTYYHPYADMMGSAFYDRHPEWRTIDRDGTPVARMSWAVPEVRERVIGALMDAVTLGADGAHIVFNRGLPVVLYEPAFATLCRERYGVDAGLLPEDDERLVTLRCEVVTGFLRQLRQRLDEEGDRRGPIAQRPVAQGPVGQGPAGQGPVGQRPGGLGSGGRLALSVCVLGTEADNAQYGLDLKAWSRAGLVDEVHVYPYNFGASTRTCDMDYLRRACQRHGVPVSPMFSPNIEADAVLAEARAYYAAGADGLGMWDAYTDDPRRMALWARLGHAEELEAWAAREPEGAAHWPIHRLDGESMDSRYPMYWGG